MLAKTISGVFGTNYRDLPVEWSQVFDTENTERAFVEEVLLTGTGLAAIKPEGRDYVMDTFGEHYKARWEIVKVGLAVPISYEAIKDNLFLNMAAKAGFFIKRSMMNFKEIMAANILNNGYDTNYPIGDGQPLFSVNHPAKGGGVISNRLATSADPSESSLESLLKQMRQARDDRGMVIGIRPRRIVAHTDQMFEWTRILQSKQRVGTADNDINAVNAMNAIGVEPAFLTRLTSSSHWYIKTDIMDGLKLYQREGLASSTYTDEATDSVVAKASERYVFGVGDYRGVFGA